ncbi:MAG: hypothetical protein QW045_00525 [Candidatus Micrarchaeaceae archaeon]
MPNQIHLFIESNLILTSNKIIDEIKGIPHTNYAKNAMQRALQSSPKN